MDLFGLHHTEHTPLALLPACLPFLVQSLAAKLKLLPKDPTSPNGYSLIPVNVWSHNVSSALQASLLLGSDYFNVVTPTELVRLLSQNVFHDCPSAPSAPTGSYTSSCQNVNATCGALYGATCETGQGYTLLNEYFDYTQCEGNSVQNCYGRLLCSDAACDCPSSPTGSYTSSCTGCRETCGVISECNCKTPFDEYGYNITYFDSSMCNGQSVANCDGALQCTGQPC